MTSVNISCPRRLASVVFRAGLPPLLHAQIHDALGMPGSGEPPLILDLPQARVAVLTGADLLFPEIATHLALARTDLVFTASTLGIALDLDPELLPRRDTETRMEELLRIWRMRANPCFHLVTVDSTGKGLAIRNDLCYMPEVYPLDLDRPPRVLGLDARTQRVKFLNTYYDFDLETLRAVGSRAVGSRTVGSGAMEPRAAESPPKKSP